MGPRSPAWGKDNTPNSAHRLYCVLLSSCGKLQNSEVKALCQGHLCSATIKQREGLSPCWGRESSMGWTPGSRMNKHAISVFITIYYKDAREIKGVIWRGAVQSKGKGIPKGVLLNIGLVFYYYLTTTKWFHFPTSQRLKIAPEYGWESPPNSCCLHVWNRGPRHEANKLQCAMSWAMSQGIRAQAQKSPIPSRSPQSIFCQG